MPSYAPAKPKTRPKYKAKKRPLNPEWLTRATRGAALLRLLMPHMDMVETQQAERAIGILDCIDKRSSNKTACDAITDASSLALAALGLRSPKADRG